MIAQTFDPHHFNQKAPRIRAQATAVLRKWGLLPRFKRWRLTQDPDTGMIVLFGILNNKYIATHTSTPFSDYFDPRLLHDLANEVQVQVVSCNSDGLRYAFILERGQTDVLPTHIDYPFHDGDQLFARVVYGKKPTPDAPEPQTPVIPADTLDDQTLVDRGVGAFLKVFDDIKLRDDAIAQNRPKIVVINADEFQKRVAEHEANRQRSQHLKELFDTAAG